MDLLDRNFRFSIGRSWNNAPGNNVLHNVRNVMDNIPLTAPSFPFPNVANMPSMNHRVNNQRHPWNVRDTSRRYRTRSNLSEMRRTIRRLRNKMHGVYDDLEDARVDLQEARESLEDAKTEVLLCTNGLQNIVDDVDNVTNALNAQITSSHMNDFERNDIRRDLQTLRREMEDARRNIRYAQDDLQEEDRNNNETRPRSRSRSRRNSVGAVANLEISSTQETNNNNPNSDLCSVCMEKPVNAVLYKCGHMCMCYQCAFKLQRRRNSRAQCPMCRAVIRDIIKTYKS